jgi:hypothetical protein
MQKLKRERPSVVILQKMIWSGLLVLLMLLGPQATLGSGLLYKNYIIRYDRGWDILCEPYAVQEGDWVLKIFRQKGEIAHNDFRDFTGIFERLNPHIRNIDMLRPGQIVDIPLKKLEHGTLPGQASGIVTIPFVTLAKVTEVVRQHSAAYEIQRGDTVSRLIARQYGRYGSKAYQEGIKLFQAANPQIKNLDVIYAGQRVYLPEPTIREQEWYAGLQDPAGNIRENIPSTGTPVVPVGRPDPGTTQEAAFASHTPLEQAASAIGGTLATKGTYYLTQSGDEDFEIDLSRYPLLSVASTEKILFTTEEEVMGKKRQAVAATWPDVKIAAIDAQASTQEIVAAIFEVLGQERDTVQGASERVIDDNGARITVRARWIKPDGDGRALCITPINSADERTPDFIRRYLEQRNIVLKEILPDGQRITDGGRQSERHAIKNILALAPAGQKDFVRNLARALGFTYSPDVAVSFPYAGVQVQAYAHLLSDGQGREVLIDFGDLYGEALEAIRQAGPVVVQITPEDSYAVIARRLLALMQLDFIDNPSFLAARRPADFNTAIVIPGVLYRKTSGERILLSAVDLHPALTDLLSTEDVALVTW